eukprot:CAMPEP_0168460822 /NCGR_PEP_ID=MMETSP0228-20121227/53647_1 /TAXON_ID=133427 /ORGANISM="Protoceratium reticulatum, Strain CCCM 535 (=CCMP 1889)" /LENGTH=147 /DNA_ID=CAMNT_0008476077 /DNA_START=113 /DNA_END=556 /DNA_ORIENTATION=+
MVNVNGMSALALLCRQFPIGTRVFCLNTEQAKVVALKNAAILLAAGADPGLPGCGGDTPESLAAASQCVPLLRLVRYFCSVQACLVLARAQRQQDPVYAVPAHEGREFSRQTCEECPIRRLPGGPLRRLCSFLVPEDRLDRIFMGVV